jgi:PIN like domain
MAETPNGYDAALATVSEVLSRTTNIDVLAALAGAIQFNLSPAPLENTVIALDANVILRLAGHRRSDDIVDYLRTAFPGRLILPGQVVQEFWNNQLLAVATKSAEIKKKYNELRGLMEGIDARFETFSDKFSTVLDEFNENFGYVFDDRTIGKTKLLIELLQEKALVPFVPRTALAETALVRKRTKTPPGFKDDQDGDFFVWSDLLLGLAQLKNEMPALERVVLVTLDRKIDWSRNGVPHPILSSEISAVCGASFETITIDVLARRLLD